MALGFGDEIMRVLIVEDDPRLARAWRHHWRRPALPSTHNADAQAFAATEPFNAIILDLGLPDGDGWNC
jgi:DNA-binding response OmpR family regulator